jgi:AraC-like DNA-binding protein
VTIACGWVNLPLLTNDDEFHRICLEHCGRILHQIKKSSPIATRLRDMFLTSPQPVPSLEAVARKLGLSSRTLRRRLNEEGHNYQSLVRDFRADLAREYLISTRMAAKEVAYRLGFDDVHSFRRAFKNWTGMTPGEYRAETLGDSGS